MDRESAHPEPARSWWSRLRRRRVIYVPQMTAADCGAACIAMVLRYHGKYVRLDALRTELGVNRDGTSANALLRTAERLGLVGRGVRVDELEQLKLLDPGTILHWDFNHFVVFERVSRTHLDIVDPAIGPRSIPIADVGKRFTGVALLFEPGERFQRGTTQRSRLWYYLRQILSERYVIIKLVLIAALMSLFGIISPFLNARFIDYVLPSQSHDLLSIFLLATISMAVFQLVMTLMRSYLMLLLGIRLDMRMALNFLHHLLSLPFSYFQQRSAGDLMMRLGSNGTIRQTLTSTMLSLALDLSLLGFYAYALFSADVTLAWLTLIQGAVQVALFLATRKRFQDLLTQELEVQARMSGYQTLMFTGMETIKSTGSESHAIQQWTRLYVDVMNFTVRRTNLNNIVHAISTVLTMICPLLLSWYGATKVMDGTLSLGTLMAITGLAGGFLAPLTSLVGTAMQMQMLRSYMARLDDVFETDAEQDVQRVRAPSTLQGNIDIEAVSYRYGSEVKDVISNVSLKIAPGQMVALVGTTGSGKSTLAKLILGLYPPRTGMIRYDGHDLRELNCRDVRRQMGIVPQNPSFIGATIRDNIALSIPDMPMDAVVEAARSAQLHHEIIAMPMGYDTPIVDGGSALSGGQRQRLAIARALALKPSILLFDEATNHLDAITESRIAESLEQMRCTRIIIAHRLSTVRRADVIVVMDSGHIIERGTHEELMERKGTYYSLVRVQMPSEAE